MTPVVRSRTPLTLAVALLTFAAAPAEDLSPARKLLQSKRAGDRLAAINMLDGAQSDAASTLLLSCLDDFDSPIANGETNNCAAMAALAKRKERRAVIPIIALLAPRTLFRDGKSVQWERSAAAARALGQIGDPRAAGPILKVTLTRVDADLKQTRAPFNRGTYNPYPGLPIPIDDHFLALGRLGCADAVPAIAKALRATRQVRNTYEGSTLPTLETIILFTEATPEYGGAPRGRAALFATLAQLPGPATTHLLIDLLNNPTLCPSDPEAALSILAAQQDPAAVAPLVNLLPNADAKLQPKIANALVALTGTNLGTARAAWDAWLNAHPTSQPTTKP